MRFSARPKNTPLNCCLSSTYVTVSRIFSSTENPSSCLNRNCSKVTLGPMFYCASTQKLIAKLETKYRQCYFDDGSLGGKVDDLMLAFLCLNIEAAKIGLHVNVQKCEFFTADQSVIHKFQSIVPEIAIVDPNATSSTGCPCRRSTFSRPAVGEEIDRAAET